MKTFTLHEVLSRERLNELLSLFSERRIGIIGDLGLDAYWYADMTRSFLSRETPRYPRPVIRESYSPGAGANVADNLKALGVGFVSVLSILGDDWRGNLLREILTTRGVNVDSILISKERNTTAFIKPILQGYDSEQEDSRLDFENGEPLCRESEDALIELLHNRLQELDGVIIADQLEINGIISERIRNTLNELAGRSQGKWFVVDSRKNIGCFRTMVLKPNWAEAVAAEQPDRDARACSLRELADIGTTLSHRNRRPVFVTLSGEGVLVCQEQKAYHIPAAPISPPIDPVGAGDTFIAALIASLASGASPIEAGAIACLAAGVSVKKLNQTGTASPEEIMQRYE